MTNLITTLPLKFYRRNDVLEVASDLLGTRLVTVKQNGDRVSGLIVETEAYMGPLDKASHAYGNRRTSRTEVMFARGGVAYVFFVYGMYYQFNVVVGEADSPLAVLVRSLEPAEGVDVMRERRGCASYKNLTSGPGKLCQALGIDRTYNGEDLRGNRIWIEKRPRVVQARQIACGPRVGIDYAEEFVESPWRFWIKDNPHVSKKR